MMLTSKHLSLASISRVICFPYQVQSIGYAFSNPCLNNFEYKFPDRIEICLRTVPEDTIPGKAIMALGNNEYTLGYPHVLVKPPGERYIYRHLELRDVFYFNYSSQLFRRFEELGLFSPPLAWELTRSPEINLLLSRLNEYLTVSHNFGTVDRIDVLCFQLLTEFLLMKNRPLIPLDPERERILQIDSYIRLHFMENIFIEEIAAQYGMSRTSFFRNWARYFDISPAKHLLNLRLQEACRHLSEGYLKINEIAQRVNISDPAYFCAIFRKKFGVTPAAYRKRFWRQYNELHESIPIM